MSSDDIQHVQELVDARMRSVTVEIQRLEALAELIRGAPECHLEVGPRTLDGCGGLLTCVLVIEEGRSPRIAPGQVSGMLGHLRTTETWVVRTGPYSCTIRGAPLSEIRAFAAMVPDFLVVLEETIRQEEA